MTAEKLNVKFDIPLGELEETIGMRLNGEFTGYDRIVSPRDLLEVKGMTFFRNEVFYALMRKIPLRSSGGERIFPYEDSRMDVFGREPRGFYLGQTFTLKEKLISIMTGLEKGIFESFVTKGISKMPPVQLYGLDREGRRVLALYIPPIAEVHGDKTILIDGIHRSTICRGAGTTVNAVQISNVGVRLPFSPITWKEVETTDEKPSIDKRYVGLKTEYFRDLGAVGIDG